MPGVTDSPLGGRLERAVPLDLADRPLSGRLKRAVPLDLADRPLGGRLKRAAPLYFRGARRGIMLGMALSGALSQALVVTMSMVVLSTGLVLHRQALDLADQWAHEEHQHGQHRQQADPALTAGSGAQETSG